MEKPAPFLKEFSKTNAQAERDALAESIRDKRQESRQEEVERNEVAEKLRGLTLEIERLSETGMSRIRNYFQLKKVRAELQMLQDQESAEPTAGDVTKTDETRRMIDDFYAEQAKQWEHAPYTKEDVEEYFSPEHLSSLSLEEYTLLLKRFPSQTVTHVTRQGIRDHFSIAEHSSGMGKQWNGFKDVLEQGKLQSSLARQITDREKEVRIAEYLGLGRFDTKEKALASLGSFTGRDKAFPGNFIDQKSVHFAAEEVADAYYGAERGNEIFFVFSAAFVASQYHFRGTLTDEFRRDKYNDVWVYQKEEQGIDINAGVVFIPGSAMVDKKTGSRYEIGADGQAHTNQEYVTTIAALVQRPDFVALAEEVLPILGTMTGVAHASGEREKQKQIDVYKVRLEQEFGLTNPGLQETVMDYHFLNAVKYAQVGELEDEVKRFLVEKGHYFKQVTSDVVPARDYWEQYFKEHPDKKPSKIVYYDGDDPTEALEEWKSKNGLEKKDSGLPTERHTDFGINSGQVPEEVLAESHRFQTLAAKVIEDYYSEK